MENNEVVKAEKERELDPYDSITFTRALYNAIQLLPEKDRGEATLRLLDCIFKDYFNCDDAHLATNVELLYRLAVSEDCSSWMY